MPVPTLILGLGGSGAAVIAHLKRQLYDTYGNRIPENVAMAVLDTARDSITTVGTEGVVRREGMGYGRVELEKYIYVHIGGDVFDIVNEVATSKKHAQIGSWFNAQYYLESNLPRQMYHLELGAGQFRQFGRMAIFNDARNATNSAIYTLLDSKLREIKSKAPQGQVSVIVIGSFVGGTGAGLFLDIPHLVRQVAEQKNIQVALRGFFFLPRAFVHTIPANEIKDARGRAFGAMRELRRFLLNQDFQYGYPMNYMPARAGVDENIWRAKSKGSLYDFVYLLDGEGERKLNNETLENGAAVNVADAISAYIDDDYGPRELQAALNQAGQVINRQGTVGRKAFINALGTYSIILPIQQMIETWSFRLGREVLDALVPGKRFTDNEHIVELDENANPESPSTRPDVEVQRLLTAQAPIPDPNDSNEQPRNIEALSMWASISNFHEKRQINEKGAENELMTYNLSTWLNILAPSASQADERIRRVRAETKSIIDEAIRDSVKNSNERKPKGDPKQDWREIKTRSDEFIIRQLGSRGDAGGRQGGRYREALKKFSDSQLERFREYIAAYIMHSLNGSLLSTRDALAAKKGRLGWLQAVFREMRQIFATVSDLMAVVQAGRGMDYGRRRAVIAESLENAENTMRENSAKPDVFGGIGGRPAIEAQESYLSRVDEYVEFFRTEFAREMVGLTISRMRDFLDGVNQELGTWTKVLAISTGSLHSELVDGHRRVRTERVDANRLPSHNVLGNEVWENQRYDQYINQNTARSRIFNSWQWRANLTTDGTFQVNAQLGDYEVRKDMQGKWSEQNREAILEFSRSVFRNAVQQESILKYLMTVKYADDADALAVELAKGAGYLLTLTGTVANIRRKMTLLVYQDGKDPNESSYVAKVLRRLASERNMGDIGEQANPNIEARECDDSFRMTLISTGDLIPLDGVEEYHTCQREYEMMNFDTRQITQIFPAEVHAVRYEEKIRTRLHQKSRILSDRVALLLENESKIEEFLKMLAHDVIILTEPSKQDTRKLWVLSAPDPDARQKTIKDWWLTLPSTESASLIDAMVTYAVHGGDIRGFQPQADYESPLPSQEALLAYLEDAQSEDTGKALDNDDLARTDAQLRTWLEFFYPSQKNADGTYAWDTLSDESRARLFAIANLVCRYDRLGRIVNILTDENKSLNAEIKAIDDKGTSTDQSYNTRTKAQELYDLYSVSLVMIEEERDRLRKLVEDRHKLFNGKPTGF